MALTSPHWKSNGRRCLLRLLSTLSIFLSIHWSGLFINIMLILFDLGDIQSPRQHSVMRGGQWHLQTVPLHGRQSQAIRRPEDWSSKLFVPGDWLLRLFVLGKQENHKKLIITERVILPFFPANKGVGIGWAGDGGHRRRTSSPFWIGRNETRIQFRSRWQIYAHSHSTTG